MNILDALQQVPDWQVVVYNVGIYFAIRVTSRLLEWVYRK